jgi:translation initiation factor IF-2
MSKKVYELASEIGIGAIDLVEKLKNLGFNVRNHMVALSDDEVAKAMQELGPKVAGSSSADSGAKKVTTRKVAKKVVVKKTQAVSSEEETQVQPPDKIEAETPEAVATSTPKTVVVKKKTLERKKATEVEARATRRLEETQGVQTRTRQADEVSDEAGLADVELYQEKMHTFTPIFVPEDVESKAESEERKKKAYKDSLVTDSDILEDIESDDDIDKKDKKRMGDLAAIVAKKGAAKAKDVTLIRAEEELKFASSILGRQIYTPVKKKKLYMGETKKTEITEVKESKRAITIFNVVTAEELAQKLSQKFENFKNEALKLNLLVKEDDYIGLQLAEELASLYNYRVENKAFDETKVLGNQKVSDKSHLPLRNPIITIMGHVDHGKTTLLDCIRNTKVTDGEAGGITQHIGAYSVSVQGATLTFLDTPGHAAFGMMRQRGANVTDIVVLVVAADDGVMPQTVESIKYARNAKCPIIVAVNKMDKEGASPEKIKQMLTEYELVSEDWGGDTMFVPISALKGDGIDNLLESIRLQAEMMDLREDPKGPVEGVIIESKVESGRGPVTTVLIQKGTLHKGDALVCGETFGRARSLTDPTGKSVESAGPSIPVQILGLNEVPSPGDILNVVKNEREAKKIVDNRIDERKKLASAVKPQVTSLEDFFATTPTEGNEKKVLNLIIRADVQGSYEAIVNAVEGLGNSEVGVNVIAGGVGAINDNDVELAASTKGFIFGFNMRPLTSARKLAEQKGVEVRNYSIIYELINDVTLALEGMLEPERVEKYIGRAEVRDTFSIPKIGTIAGSAVIDGKIERGCNIRLLREGKIIYDGKLSTLKRFKDEVKEVANGYECGMALEGFNDIKVSDLIEAYILEEKKRKLEAQTNL